MSRYSDTLKIIRDKKLRLGTSSLPQIKIQLDGYFIDCHEVILDLLSQEYCLTPEFWWFRPTVNKLSTINIPVYTIYRCTNLRITSSGEVKCLNLKTDFLVKKF